MCSVPPVQCPSQPPVLHMRDNPTEHSPHSCDHWGPVGGGGREGGREGVRDGGREGGREGRREVGSEGGREGGR